MSNIRYQAMPTEDARRYQSGGPDAYGQEPETRVSDGDGIPCRHCLNFVAKGDRYLVLAYRPFPRLQPYAETGPIFLHAEECPRFEDSATRPPILASSPDYILRGYGEDDRIIYGTGAVTPVAEMEIRAGTLLERDDVAYVHIRSARNNCYQARINRHE